MKDAVHDTYREAFSQDFSVASWDGGRLSNMVKKCLVHGRVHHISRSDGSYRCGKCASEWVVRSRKSKKKKLVELFGGKCVVCGYDAYVGALDFHHINPKKKEFSLSVKGLCYSWGTILKEAEKCILVCKNCHAEIEAGITSFTQVN